MDTSFAMDRRALLQRMTLLLGAASLPTEALAAPAKRAKRFLKPPQFALLSAVADTILPATDTPGALAAQVPARLDGLLASWAAPQTRSGIVAALDRIEAAARAQTGKKFARLSAVQRDAVLRPHDIAALKRVPPPADAPKGVLFATFVADQAYFQIKDLVLALYYYSEIASAQELLYEHVPGQWQPSIKLTPQSRPFLGVGFF